MYLPLQDARSTLKKSILFIYGKQLTWRSWNRKRKVDVIYKSIKYYWQWYQNNEIQVSLRKYMEDYILHVISGRIYRKPKYMEEYTVFIYYNTKYCKISILSKVIYKFNIIYSIYLSSQFICDKSFKTL